METSPGSRFAFSSSLAVLISDRLSLPVLENVTSYMLVEPNEKVNLDYDFPALKRGSPDSIGINGIALYNAKR